jgi:PAS domain S-box-containing protein
MPSYIADDLPPVQAPAHTAFIMGAAGLTLVTTILVYGFSQATKSAPHADAWMAGAFIFGALVHLGLLVWAYRRPIRKGSPPSVGRSRHQHRQDSLLAAALTSIGDGVIITNLKGRIILINKVAETLTGWSSVDAIGRECSEIFHIVNESTRARVTSPVQEVLRLGPAVGLPANTLLVRRNGVELPISDSGAPIRDETGELFGVVLVFRDFSEHHRSEAALRQAKVEAETANHAKDNFLATLSHELRTPLTPVVATLATWEADESLSSAMQKDVQIMRRNVALEARLIDDLLDLTRIAHGKMRLRREATDIHELLAAVVDICQAEISAQDLHFSMRLDARKHFALVDPSRLQQVFWNILKNATKFAREGGKIGICTRNDAEDIEVTFWDDGIGMSKEMLSRVFRPFEQDSEANLRLVGGLGLGMAISRSIMDAQEGTIEASSDGPGLGSKFIVTVPCEDTPTAAMPPKVLSTPAARAIHILLVEDHSDTAVALTRLLLRNGHRVTCTTGVAEAKVALDTQHFDMLLCDVGLPDGTGIEIAAHLRTFSQMPAIALTGFGMERDVQECLTAGFSSHLTKPLNLLRLSELIADLSKETSPS